MKAVIVCMQYGSNYLKFLSNDSCSVALSCGTMMALEFKSTMNYFNRHFSKKSKMAAENSNK